MSKHTREPWVLFEVGDRYVHLCPASAADKTSILTVSEEDGVSFGAVYNDDDARRIVACVNACRGLPTDELEHKGLIAAVGTQLLEADKQREELSRLLLEAQRYVRYRLEYTECDARIVMGLIADFDAAIAKAKGGAS